MECKLDVTLLQDLLEGIIDPIDKLFVEEHLRSCKKCRKELAELKLLFWDLNDKTNYDISIPVELDKIKDSLLQEFAVKPIKNTTEIVLDVHRKNAKVAGIFLSYVPGIKASNELVKKGVSTAPSALGKISKAIYKSTRFLLAE